MDEGSEQKTEKPTPRRLRQARERGEVVRSNDVTSALVLVVLASAFAIGAGFFWRHLQALSVLPLRALERGDFEANLPWLLQQLAREFAYLVLPLIALMFCAGAAGAYWQVGGLLSFEPIKPQIARLNPAQGLKRLFSARSLIEFAKMLLKLIVIGALIYFVVRGAFSGALKYPYLAPREIAALSGSLLIHLLVYAGLLYLMLSTIDYSHQYYEFMKKQRMSKQELRREYKETEGDPHIRSSRRFLARELAFEDVRALTRSASVVVDDANLAVALHYDANSGSLPSVLVKGSAAMADKIRQAAQEAGILIHRDGALARRLHENTAQGGYISAALFEDVARVLTLARQHAPAQG
jgi:type III secretion protein U